MTGFFHQPDSDPQQYVRADKSGLNLGVASPIKAPVIQPDRDWRAYRPSPEIQTKNGFDPLSCASYGTLNAIEMYLHRVYGVKKNYSDRWLATKTGTKAKGGNDPHYVFEYIRRNGVVEESAWPFTTQQTYDEYYSGNPALDEIAEDFNKDFKLEHDSIYGDADDIWDALQYCPVPLSVHWNRTDNGYWWKEGNGPDTHWCVADYGVLNDFIGIFDSGEPSDKKATWSKLQPQLAKRFTITKRTEDTQITLMKRVIALLIKLRDALMNKGVVEPAKPPIMTVEAPHEPEPTPASSKATIDNFCLAIRTHEGWYKGSRSWRNNNPGNLRKWPTQVGTDGGFAVFANYEQGWAALRTLVRNAMANKGSYKNVKTIADFFKVYAPAADSNNPHAYALSVAKRCGVTIHFEIKKLV